jgi:DNA topoisomerase-2
MPPRHTRRVATAPAAAPAITDDEQVAADASRFSRMSALAHLFLKPMYCGPFLCESTTQHIVGAEYNSFTLTDVSVVPAIYKMFDEAFVNAVDHRIYTAEHKKSTDKVTKISVSFDQTTGTFTIANNGIGMPIEMMTIKGEHEGAPDVQMYIPEAACSMVRTGANHDDEDRLSGGTNGLGLKFIMANSREFTIRTCDGVKTFEQRFENRFVLPTRTALSEANCNFVRHEPRITAVKSPKGTTITFTPIYERVPELRDTTAFAVVMRDLDMLVRTRIVMASPYVGIKINYCGRDTPATSLSTLVSAILPGTTRTALLKPTGLHPWSICVQVCDKGPGFATYTLINGAVVTQGTHISYYKKQLVEAVKARVKSKYHKEISDADVYNRIILIMNGIVVNPQWKDQSKTQIGFTSAFMAKYALGKSTIDSIWADYIEARPELADAGRVTRRAHQNIDGYTPAAQAGKAGHAHKCWLWIGEGDSAIKLVKDGVAANAKSIDTRYMGFTDCRGVPPNARKGAKYVAGGKVIPSREYLNNKKMQDIFDHILGLNRSAKYDNTAEGNASFAKLPYGQIVLAVDQDVDGVGNILGLLLSNIWLIWPALIERGYIKRISTPVIRAKPKSGSRRGRRGALKILSFFSEIAYDRWRAETAADVLAKYEIVYYKGLGRHNREDAAHMFSQLDRMICTYTAHDAQATTRAFELYFGNDADPRKTLLSTPAPDEIIPYGDVQEVSCIDTLRVETRAFDEDKLGRHLPCVLSGMREADIKALCGALDFFANTSRNIKVFQLSGYIAEKKAYHHGEMSLNGVVMGMAQTYLGARVLPMLVPEGQFGSRDAGGKDAASPRYASTRLNKDLVDALFPRADFELYPMREVDGDEAEFRYMISTIPMSICNNFSQPATGWRVQIIARDPLALIELTRKTIRGESISYEDKCIPPDTWGFTGRIVDANDAYYSVGVYTIRGNTIRVTELPYQKWTNKFVKSLEIRKNVKDSSKTRIGGKGEFVGYIEYVDNVHAHPSVDGVDVEIKLKAGGLEAIRAKSDDNFDGVIKYFKLYTKLDSFLNFTRPDGSVFSAGCYYDVFTAWYTPRRDLYVARQTRQMILLRLRIIRLENLVRFSANGRQYKLDEVDDDEAIAILERNNYAKINHVVLDRPGRLATDRLEDVILRGEGASYDYILDTSFRKLLMKRACDARERQLAELRRQLAELEARREPFVGAQQWLDELDKLTAAIAHGRKTRWLYSDPTVQYA